MSKVKRYIMLSEQGRRVHSISGGSWLSIAHPSPPVDRRSANSRGPETFTRLYVMVNEVKQTRSKPFKQNKKGD